jgi:hypothetical protein
MEQGRETSESPSTGWLAADGCTVRSSFFAKKRVVPQIDGLECIILRVLKSALRTVECCCLIFIFTFFSLVLVTQCRYHNSGRTLVTVVCILC